MTIISIGYHKALAEVAGGQRKSTSIETCMRQGHSAKPGRASLRLALQYLAAFLKYIILSKATFLLGVPSNTYGFPQILKCHFRVQD